MVDVKIPSRPLVKTESTRLLSRFETVFEYLTLAKFILIAGSQASVVDIIYCGPLLHWITDKAVNNPQNSNDDEDSIEAALRVRWHLTNDIRRVKPAVLLDVTSDMGARPNG
ncbi:MAG: hypothetical protein M3O09_17895 [Acidobacteriota bacterium]|nr:hypothetical protein [Acidobacteriota bacterium]